VRVLVVHNRYRSGFPSGENVVVDEEIDALERAGVTVIPYVRSSDEIARMPLHRKLIVPLMPLLARPAVHDIDSLLTENKVDVVHIHNVYPLVSPAVVRVAKRHRVPVVHTVHNQRHVCARGTYFRDGHPCFECRQSRLKLPSVVHGCYRDSRLQSLPMAASLVAHESTWRMVDRFLALTQVIADELTRIGIPPERIVVRSNTAPDPGQPGPDSGPIVLFAGRLEREKGVDLLLQAWQLVSMPTAQLRIAGDGPLDGQILAAAKSDERIIPLGRLDPVQMSRQMGAARAVVVPSRCPEAFPRVVVEAFAHGRPVIATSVGGLPSIVRPEVGWVVAPDPGRLAGAISEALVTDEGRAASARELYERLLRPEVVLDQLLQVYDSVTT
jgi:glycosyltransferase involved in cell wall biosynthesis